jgi:hypothetical protein
MLGELEGKKEGAMQEWRQDISQMAPYSLYRTLLLTTM